MFADNPDNYYTLGQDVANEWVGNHHHYGQATPSPSSQQQHQYSVIQHSQLGANNMGLYETVSSPSNSSLPPMSSFTDAPQIHPMVSCKNAFW